MQYQPDCARSGKRLSVHFAQGGGSSIAPEIFLISICGSGYNDNIPLFRCTISRLKTSWPFVLAVGVKLALFPKSLIPLHFLLRVGQSLLFLSYR